MVILAQSSKRGLSRSGKKLENKLFKNKPKKSHETTWENCDILRIQLKGAISDSVAGWALKCPVCHSFTAKDQGGNVVAALLWPNWRFCLSVSILAGKKFYSTPRHPYHLSYTWNNLKTIKHFKFSDALKRPASPHNPTPPIHTHKTLQVSQHILVSWVKTPGY